MENLHDLHDEFHYYINWCVDKDMSNPDVREFYDKLIVPMQTELKNKILQRLNASQKKHLFGFEDTDLMEAFKEVIRCKAITESGEEIEVYLRPEDWQYIEVKLK